MPVTILDDSMSSNLSAHTARAVPGTGHLWEVSWLPGRHLYRSTAITAMVLAHISNHEDIRPGHRFWPDIESWAAALGLNAHDALARAAAPPGRAAPVSNAEPSDPEAGQ
jgi:hypothetical protein